MSSMFQPSFRKKGLEYGLLDGTGRAAMRDLKVAGSTLVDRKLPSAENVIEAGPGRRYEKTFLRTELPEGRIVGMMWDY